MSKTMKRKIIRIDEDKCNGCGECIVACHEGALQIIDGKARLISDVYCDGLGDCLGECPEGAITLVERETLPYDQEAVDEHLKNQQTAATTHKTFTSCPGSRSLKIERGTGEPPEQEKTASAVSRLEQWPCQLKLVPPNAPYFEKSHLLIAADCTAYAYANIHEDFMKNRVTLIGCPKLDSVDYGDKITEILESHEIKSVTVLKMVVPCCGGIAHSVIGALQDCGKMIPWNVVTINTDGTIIKD